MAAVTPSSGMLATCYQEPVRFHSVDIHSTQRLWLLVGQRRFTLLMEDDPLVNKADATKRLRVVHFLRDFGEHATLMEVRLNKGRVCYKMEESSPVKITAHDRTLLPSNKFIKPLLMESVSTKRSF
jgi:hypothetical protein